MKDEFEQRWKLTAAAARSAGLEPEAAAPFGMAARVLALAREQAARPSATSLWQLLCFRTLGGLAAALAVVAALEIWLGEEAGLRPTVEQSVEEQIFWLPS